MSQYPIIKKCFKCGETKPLSEFYKHKEMADGHLNKCKECTKRDARENREKNIDKIREYDRNRPNHKERILKHLLRMKRLKNENPKKYEQYLSSKRKWAKRNRKKKNAHTKVKRAIERGIIKRPNRCESCWKECVPEAHHPDYNRPLYVVWLCKKCHVIEHKIINEQKRRMAS